MRVHFWGTRGSIPSPGPKTVKYGGNTTCLELRLNDGSLCIIDAGSGIRLLGQNLLQNDFKENRKSFHLLFTHTHWDHILGFPFFTPIYIPGVNIEIIGPVSFQKDSLEHVLKKQMSYHVFPVNYSELGATMSFQQVKEGEYSLNSDTIFKTRYLNHPVATIGYRFESAGKTVVIAFDHEPYQNLFPGKDSPDYDESAWLEAEEAVKLENQRVLDFFRDADILIHDAQYREDEYEKQFKGWGHSPYNSVVENAIKANVKHIILTHHEPNRSDDELDQIHNELAKKYNNAVEISIAKEGEDYSV